jgi:2-amino-4-hydroxy-6-hydroxymethyldihydropteridine diphosphokinase
VTAFFLILGSNFGFPVSSILSGIEALRKYGEVASRSSLYLTEPVDRTYQMGFVNGGVKFISHLEPDRLIWILKDVEKKAGRLFSSAKIHRSLDIDVAAADITHSSGQISIPHPALSKRRFMLVPLCELASEFPAMEDGRTFKELLDMCVDPCEVVRI